MPGGRAGAGRLLPSSEVHGQPAAHALPQRRGSLHVQRVAVDGQHFALPAASELAFTSVLQAAS